MARYNGRSKAGGRNVKAIDVATILQRAGWYTTHEGNHWQARKAGFTTIRFQEPFNALSWRNVENALGVAVETLIHKRQGRTAVTREEWHQRIALASSLIAAGFQTKFVIKHAGLAAWYNVGFRPQSIAERDPDQLIDHWTTITNGKATPPRVHSVPVTAAVETSPEQLPLEEPIEDSPEYKRLLAYGEPALATIIEEAEAGIPADVRDAALAAIEPAHDDMSAVLELMADMNAKLNAIRKGVEPEWLSMVRAKALIVRDNAIIARNATVLVTMQAQELVAMIDEVAP